jgi:hypothetical protein
MTLRGFAPGGVDSIYGGEGDDRIDASQRRLGPLDLDTDVKSH